MPGRSGWQEDGTRKHDFGAPIRPPLAQRKSRGFGNRLHSPTIEVTLTRASPGARRQETHMTHLRMRVRRSAITRSLSVLVLAFALSACSFVPDFANPISIFNNTFGNDSSDSAEDSAEDTGGDSSQAYPRLAAETTRPQAESAAERRRVTDGLIADRQNARYIDDGVRGADASGPAFVAPERRARPVQPRAGVQVASVEAPRGQKPPSRALPRPRDPAAPVPIEPRRRPGVTAAPDPVESRRRLELAAARAAIEARRQNPPPSTVAVKPRRQDPSASADTIKPRPRPRAAQDPVDSRRMITTGRVGGPQQGRALIPRQRAPVPISIVQRADEDAGPRRGQSPASAPVSQPTRVARLEEGSSIRKPAPASAPPPAAVVQAEPTRQPPSRRRTPTQPPPVALAPGENVLSKVYAEMLAASASTVTSAPANSAFKPTAALPLPQETLGVSPAARASYNASLTAASAPRAAPGTRVVESSSIDSARSRGQARPRAAGRSQRPSQVAALVVPASPASPPPRRAIRPQPSALVTDPNLIVKFANGSSRVTSRNRSLLRGIAAQARERGAVIRVVGHSSSRTRNLPLAEHNLINFRVSLDRAQSVANQLMRQGVPPGQIIVEARGDTDPIFFETMPEGEAENRRVEIFLDF